MYDSIACYFRRKLTPFYCKWFDILCPDEDTTNRFFLEFYKGDIECVDLDMDEYRMTQLIEGRGQGITAELLQSAPNVYILCRIFEELTLYPVYEEDIKYLLKLINTKTCSYNDILQWHKEHSEMTVLDLIRYIRQKKVFAGAV